MKQIFISLIAALSLNTSAAGAPPTADQIVKRADLARGPSGAVSFFVKIRDYKSNALRGETTYKVYVKGATLALIETMDPPRLKGRKLLMNDNNLWFFLPTIKRPTRVSLQQRLTGEVANGDVARTNFAEDYSAKILGQEKVLGKDCYKLELTAKTKDVTYQRLWYWVTRDSLQPVKTTFFALSGKPLKHAVYSDFKAVFGRPTMTRVIITDELQPHQRSELLYANYRQENLDDGFFNKDSLAD